MKLRTRLNLVLAGLTGLFIIVLFTTELRSARDSVREEIEASSRVAVQFLGQLAVLDSRQDGSSLALQFLQQLGRVRANDIALESARGEVLYHSPPPTYKAGRAVPAWFAELLAPGTTHHVFALPGGAKLLVDADASRSILDAWDDMTRLLLLSVGMLVAVNGTAFWLVGRALAPFPVIAQGLERIERGKLGFRLPPLAGHEAGVIGAAFNRMAQAVQDKVHAERKAHEAETRLEERQEMAGIVEQKIEEERRLIAHELHDEFGQSVTAIRSLARAIATQGGARDAATGEAAQLISDEAARLYDNMHGLIPRLTPLSLDTLGLASTLDNLVKEWQRRNPAVELSLQQDFVADLGPGVTLTIYRVVQEALINALRHAQAAHIEVVVGSRSNSICVNIFDDGVGLPADWARPGHFGLRGLAARVERLGGTFLVANRAQRGTEVGARIPLGGEA